MQPSPRLVSLNVGEPAPLALPRGVIESAIVKAPVASAMLADGGLEGDRQADLAVHGGRDKAVCVYPFEHYPFWEEQFGLSLEPGGFGENFTTSGLIEAEVCIGDIYEVGEATVQVTQPRQPCFRLAARHERPELPKWVVSTGFTGFYLRAASPGSVPAGAPLRLVERPAPGVTVSMVNAVLFGKAASQEDLVAVVRAPGLAADLRRALLPRLARARSGSR